MIQQPDSPLTPEHSESKYRKALAEIHKIHSANRVLKAETESVKMQSEQRVREIAQSLEKMQQRSQNAEREILRLLKEKTRQEKNVQDLLSTCANLMQQKSRLTQEIAFLTTTITEQGIELRRVSALKGDKNVSILVTSYEERELSYRNQIACQEELVASLQKSVKGAEEELKSERRKIWQLSQSNNILRAEVQNYKNVNASLLERSETLLLTAISGRKSDEKEKYRQAGAILSEMGRQLDLIRSSRAQQQEQRIPIAKANDKLALENHKLSQELQRTRTRLKSIEERVGESLQLQEKLKLTSLKMQYLQEECNTLKRKLVVLETSQSINEENQQWLKNIKGDSIEHEFDKTNIAKSPDISHFQLMKTYILDAKRRLSQALLDKKQLQKKYRAVKEKFADRAQRALQLEEQQKILLAKLDGFQKLTERLQFQLERSLHANQEEIVQIKTSARVISDKQVQQAEIRIAQVEIQSEKQFERFRRAEEELRLEVNALQEELSNEKSRGRDIQFQLEQVNEFLAIYKDKFEQLQTHNQELEEMHAVLSENALRFQQLYREERVKNDVLAAQKQSLTAKLTRTNEQMDRRQQEESEGKQREAAYEYQLGMLRNQLQQVRSEATQLHNTLRAASNQVEESRLTISGAARSEGGYHSSLEQNYQKERQRNKLLESEIAALKQKLDQTILQAQRAALLEDALSAKSEELSDIKRRTAGFDKEVGLLESEIRRIRSEYDNLKKENGILKNRLMEGGQELRKSVAARGAEGEKQSQRMSEELATTNIQLRQEKRRTARLQLELQATSGELRRSEQLLEQVRRKEKDLSEQLITLRSAYDSACQENTRIRSQIHYEKNIQEGLKNDVQVAQGRIKQLKQQNSELSLKVQSHELGVSDLKRQMGALKVYLPEIQSMVIKSSSGWQEQREKENLTNFLLRIKKLLKVTYPSVDIRPEQDRTQTVSPSKSCPPNKPSPSEPEYFKYQEKAAFGAEPALAIPPEPFFTGGVDHEELTSQYHDYLQ